MLIVLIWLRAIKELLIVQFVTDLILNMKNFKLEKDLEIENDPRSDFEKLISGFLILILTLLLLSIPQLIKELRYLDYGFFDSTISSYSTLDDRALNRDLFEINKKSQYIIWTMPDSKTVSPRKYTNCVISNRKNWICKDRIDGEFGFRDGKYFNRDDIGITYVSKREWLLMKKK